MRRRCRWCLLTLVLVGCDGGPELHPAGGTVVFADGGPVPGGVIEFAPVDGGPIARGRIDSDGRFTLATNGADGAVAGTHRLAVVQTVPLPDDRIGKHAAHRDSPRSVHRRYSGHDTSGLEEQVRPGTDNHFRVEVSAER